MGGRLAAVLLIALLGGCGDDGGGGGSGEAGPLVEQIGPAVEALEAALGAQDYFEINADHNKVTLWVAAEEATRALPYVFAAGELSDAQDSQEAAGETFTAAEGLTFDPDTVLDQVVDDLGVVDQFSIVGGPGDVVRFSAIVQSDRGGVLEVVVDADGDVLESGEIG